MMIHVVGFYDKLNVGDEAFRPAFLDFFDGHQVKFFDIDLYRNSPPPEPDVLVLGGGDVVTPYYLPVIDKSSCKKKLAIGVGLGYESESDLGAASSINGWFLRNKKDVSLLSAKTKVLVEYTPDLAFRIQPSGASVLSRYCDPSKPTVAVLLTDYMMPSGKRQKDLFWNRSRGFLPHFGEACESLLASGYQLIGVPCSTDRHADDRRVHYSVRAFVDGGFAVVNEQLSPQDMVDLLADTQYAICQRFHAHVFCMIAGVPILSVGFTRKVSLLLQAAGAGVDTGCFKGGEYVEKDFVGLFNTVVSEADTVRTRFKTFALENHAALSRVKSRVRQLIA